MLHNISVYSRFLHGWFLYVRSSIRSNFEQPILTRLEEQPFQMNSKREANRWEKKNSFKINISNLETFRETNRWWFRDVGNHRSQNACGELMRRRELLRWIFGLRLSSKTLRIQAIYSIKHRLLKLAKAYDTGSTYRSRLPSCHKRLVQEAPCPWRHFNLDHESVIVTN